MIGYNPNPSALNRSHPLNRDVEGVWTPSLGATGQILRDVSGNHHHGTLVNGPTWSPEHHPGGRGCLSFDNASSQQVTIPTLAEPLSYPCTLTAWFRPVAISGGAVYCMIDVSHSSTVANGFMLELTNGNVFARIQSTSAAISTTKAVAGKWHFAAAVFHSATLREAYLDAGGKGTATASQTPTTPDDAVIGVGNFSRVMDGELDDVRIYRRALSQAEIHQLYTESLRGYPNLLNHPRRRVYSIPTAAGGGGATVPIFAKHYSQLRTA